MSEKTIRKRAREERLAREGVHSRGREALREWLSTSGASQESVAKKLDVSQVAVNNWVNGRSRPINPLREALELLAGIAAASWETDEDAAIRDEALRRIQAEKVAS